MCLDKFFVDNLVLLEFWNFCKLFFLCGIEFNIIDLFIQLKSSILVFFYFTFLIRLRKRRFLKFKQLYRLMLRFKKLKFLFFIFYPHFVSVDRLSGYVDFKLGIPSYLFLMEGYANHVIEKQDRVFYDHKVFKRPSSIVLVAHNLF